MFQYTRHKPENTLLYQIVNEYYPKFLSQLADEGRRLPEYVQKEFDDYLKCGLLQYGFLRVRCEECRHEKLVAFSCKHRGFCPSCGAKRMIESAALLVDNILPYQSMRQWVLSVPFPLRFLFASQPVVMNRVLRIVYRIISSFLIKKAKFKKKTAKTGAVTFIQRFGSALNLNVHFHILFLDGVYMNDKNGLRFIPVFEPQKEELNKLTHKIALRIGRYLERAGYVERDADNSFLTEDALAANEIGEHQSHSIQYRIAMGPQKGKKVFSLQTMVPTMVMEEESVAKISGFSLHAGVSIKANQRDKLERICRYISRPALSTHRLSLTPQGKIRYELKTPYRNGTTHMIFEPVDFISKLAALIPIPRVNLVRFHGVFAPHSRDRKAIVPGKKEQPIPKSADDSLQTENEKRVAMNWARRLKRAFQIDIQKCEACGGKVKIIACIEDPAVINQILSHLKHSAMNDQLMRPMNRAPPLSGARVH